MTNDQFPDDEQPPRPQQDPTRPNQNWDNSRVDKGKIIFALVIIAVVLVLIFAVSMCSREAAVVPGNEQMGGGDILQRNVDAAFETGREGRNAEERGREEPQGGISGEAARQSEEPTAEMRERERQMQQTPEERQMEALQQQQQLDQQREEMQQQQREAVPSLLPENPPQPAPLGQY